MGYAPGTGPNYLELLPGRVSLARIGQIATGVGGVIVGGLAAGIAIVSVPLTGGTSAPEALLMVYKGIDLFILGLEDIRGEPGPRYPLPLLPEWR